MRESTPAGINPASIGVPRPASAPRGIVGRPFDQLGGKVFCPWSLDVDVDYNSSIFDSRFLEFEYRDFLGQIGFVPAMAASVKGTLGPGVVHWRMERGHRPGNV